MTFLIVATAISIFSYTLFVNMWIEGGTLHIQARTWDYRQIIFVSVIVAISVVFYILTIRSFYYQIEDKYFIAKRYGKEIQYSYENIIFINEAKSEAKKKIVFYTEKTQMVSMLADSENKVYKTLLKKCKNLMTLEEFQRRHPEEKL